MALTAAMWRRIGAVTGWVVGSTAAVTGAAVVGTAQFAMAGAVTPLTGLGGEFTAVPMLVCMAVCAVVSLGLVLAARR